MSQPAYLPYKSPSLLYVEAFRGSLGPVVVRWTLS